jgi:hypothetical protein
MQESPATATYWLVDAAMVGGIADILGMDGLPAWCHPLYAGGPLQSYGPLLVDRDSACRDGDAARIDALLNGLQPALHVSNIAYAGSAARLAAHLRTFLTIRDADGNAWWLRLADARVLINLPRILTPEQWLALAGPIERWTLHTRDDRPVTLPAPNRRTLAASMPLVLSREQTERLCEAAEPDRLRGWLADENDPANGSEAEQYRWAKETLAVGRKSGKTTRDWLLPLARIVFASQGRLLAHPALCVVLRKSRALEDFRLWLCSSTAFGHLLNDEEGRLCCGMEALAE